MGWALNARTRVLRRGRRGRSDFRDREGNMTLEGRGWKRLEPCGQGMLAALETQKHVWKHGKNTKYPFLILTLYLRGKTHWIHTQ